MKPVNWPIALYINSSGGFSSEDTLLAQILDAPLPESPSRTFLDNKVNAYELKLETKYYSTAIWLSTISDRTIGSKDFSELVEAVVLRFDGSWLSEIDSWLPFLKEWEPDLKILVCSQVSSDEQLKKGVTDWCTENEFELVELEPSKESREEAEEYGEITGVARIRQILKAHSWSNLELKEDSSSERNERLRKFLEKEEGDTQASSSSKPEPEKTQENPLSAFTDEKALFGALGNEDPGEMSFEEMFSKFASLKEEAEKLPPEERKKHAETVAMAFWRAIGGEDEEITGLDD